MQPLNTPAPLSVSEPPSRASTPCAGDALDADVTSRNQGLVWGRTYYVDVEAARTGMLLGLLLARGR